MQIPRLPCALHINCIFVDPLQGAEEREGTREEVRVAEEKKHYKYVEEKHLAAAFQQTVYPESHRVVGERERERERCRDKTLSIAFT